MVTLQHVLHPHQEVRKNFRRDGHVFDHRNRPAGALHPAQRRLDLADQTPEQLGFGRVERVPCTERQTPAMPHLVDHTLQPVHHVHRIFATQFDQHHGFCFRWDQQIEADLALPGETHVSAVEQIARGRFVTEDIQRRP